jgi:excisionase family DNA binding protein
MQVTIQGKKDEFFTTDEAASYLGFAQSTITQYVQRGLLKPAKRIGRSWLFTRSECDRYNEEKRSPGKPRKIS